MGTPIFRFLHAPNEWRSWHAVDSTVCSRHEHHSGTGLGEPAMIHSCEVSKYKYSFSSFRQMRVQSVLFFKLFDIIKASSPSAPTFKVANSYSFFQTKYTRSRPTTHAGRRPPPQCPGGGARLPRPWPKPGRCPTVTARVAVLGSHAGWASGRSREFSPPAPPSPRLWTFWEEELRRYFVSSCSSLAW